MNKYEVYWKDINGEDHVSIVNGFDHIDAADRLRKIRKTFKYSVSSMRMK